LLLKLRPFQGRVGLLKQPLFRIFIGMKIKAIITGSTGMVGEGVLHECLLSPEVESILVINRRPCGYKHPKLKEIIHSNFFDFSEVKERLDGFNACFFCLGVSSVGMNEEKYHRFTYDLTMSLANTLVSVNSEMVFCYVSGVGTDSSEKGRSMWARVKGKTENQLIKMPFRNAFMFRPGYIQPTKGLKNSYKIYKLFAPLYPIWKTLFPKYVCTLREIGLAMINAANKGYDKKILEVTDIKTLARN
jgi:hypothetical protein